MDEFEETDGADSIADNPVLSEFSLARLHERGLLSAPHTGETPQASISFRIACHAGSKNFEKSSGDLSSLPLRAWDKPVMTLSRASLFLKSHAS